MLKLPVNESFLSDVMKIAKEKQIDSQLSRYHFDLDLRILHSKECKIRRSKDKSLHQMAYNFITQRTTITADRFILYMESCLSNDLCKQIEISTKEQANNILWHEMRYRRITASKIYEVSRCKTADGSLVNQILGAYKVKDSKAIERGRKLEKEVLQQVEILTNKDLKKAGLYLMPEYPMLGASPDAIGEDFIVEVKCPSNEENLKNYLVRGKISPKCKAQMQLQMMASKMSKGLFCVADVGFEQNRKVHLQWLELDLIYISSIIEKALTFWTSNIFPRLLKSVNS